MEIRVAASLDSSARRVLHMPPLAWLVLVPAVAWLLLEIVVGFDYVHDRYVAYEGTVLEVRSSWTDPLTRDFMPVKHLVIRTPAGGIIDRSVPVEELAHARVAAGDSVVKERGFFQWVQVPGKPTVSEMLETAGARLDAARAGAN